MTERDSLMGDRDPNGHGTDCDKPSVVRESITMDQRGCARCDGEGHPAITYQPFTFPIDFGDGSIATHWALCPTNGEPILYVVVSKEKA